MEGVERMMADIEREVEYTRHMIGRDHLSERVMDAMRTVPRVAFVPMVDKREVSMGADGSAALARARMRARQILMPVCIDLKCRSSTHGQ